LVAVVWTVCRDGHPKDLATRDVASAPVTPNPPNGECTGTNPTLWAGTTADRRGEHGECDTRVSHHTIEKIRREDHVLHKTPQRNGICQFRVRISGNAIAAGRIVDTQESGCLRDSACVRGFTMWSFTSLPCRFFCRTPARLTSSPGRWSGYPDCASAPSPPRKSASSGGRPVSSISSAPLICILFIGVQYNWL
jgi:hypothetical protein